MADESPHRAVTVGIVTVTFNSEPVLEEFFDSLAHQSYRDYTLYVVDNASRDRTLDMCRTRSDIRVKIRDNGSNVGVAKANNQGIQDALRDGCEEILLLNNDTVLAPDLIGQLRAGLERHSAEMTTAKMYYHDSPEILWCAGGHFRKWRGMDSIHDGPGSRDVGQFDQPRRVAYTPTCCLLLRRSVIDKVGLMDERYFVYYDDTDYLLRCMKRGIVLWYIPTARLWHKVSSLTSSESDFTARYCARNRIYYLRKHLSPFEACFWYAMDQLQFAVSVLLRRSSFKRWLIRQKAAREGFSMRTIRDSGTSVRNT